jgi:hypothetical protein
MEIRKIRDGIICLLMLSILEGILGVSFAFNIHLVPTIHDGTSGPLISRLVRSLIWALEKGGGSRLTVLVVIGIVLLMMALILLLETVRMRHHQWLATVIIGAVGFTIAFLSGLIFLGYNNEAYGLITLCTAAIALTSYIVSLVIVEID